MSTNAAAAEPERRHERLDLRDVRAFLLDLDGVLYRGETALPGARELLELLRVRGIPHLFLTNNSSRTPVQYADKLGRMGIRATPDRILTSAIVAVADLQRHAAPHDRVLMLGGAGLREALALSTLELATDWRQATIVLVGLDVGITYGKLAQAALAIGRGARFVGTNGDRSFPTERGLEPGAGALLAALEATTGVAPRTFGKPEPEMFEEALRRLGVPPDCTAMVGDRWDTDIAGAARCGIVTIAVTTGVCRDEELRGAEPPPDHILPSVAELRAALE
jgi:4-nitrophenyl phosphatase